MISRQSYAFSCNSRITIHITVKLHLTSPRAITGLLLVQLFSNCTQMCVIIPIRIINCNNYNGANIGISKQFTLQ